MAWEKVPVCLPRDGDRTGRWKPFCRQNEMGVQYTIFRWDKTGRDRCTGRKIDQVSCLDSEYFRDDGQRYGRECLAWFGFRAAEADPPAPSTSTSSMVATSCVCTGPACVSGFF